MPGTAREDSSSESSDSSDSEAGVMYVEERHGGEKQAEDDEDDELDSDSEPEAVEPIVWHTIHNDPFLDVVLRSSDHVFLRASSFVLKRESALFNGMLSTLPNPFMNTDNAIPLEYSAASLSLFLDCYTSHSPLDYHRRTFDQLREHRKLVHELDCDRLIPHVDKAYRRICQQHPKSWLIAASDDNDLDEAKEALLQCAQRKKGLDTASVFELVWKIRKDWWHPLLRCIMDGDGATKQKEAGLLKISWPDRQGVEEFEEDVERSREEDEDK